MFDYTQMKAEYTAKIQEYEAKRDEYRRLQGKHEKLSSKYEKLGLNLKYPHWMEHYLTPIARELTTYFPEANFEVSGPFGLACQTSISIHGKDNVLLAFLEFVLEGDQEIMLRDYSVDTGRFSQGTIAEMNGMNHPNIPIPDENTIDWFLGKIKYLHRTVSGWDSAKPKAQTAH